MKYRVHLRHIGSGRPTFRWSSRYGHGGWNLMLGYWFLAIRERRYSYDASRFWDLGMGQAMFAAKDQRDFQFKPHKFYNRYFWYFFAINAVLIVINFIGDGWVYSVLQFIAVGFVLYMSYLTTQAFKLEKEMHHIAVVFNSEYYDRSAEELINYLTYVLRLQGANVELEDWKEVNE